MILHFYKYQATGNDFIVIDQNENFIEETDTNLIRKLCDRHFGIGADGLIILKKHLHYDFEMKYFNSDGNIATLCGNGGRCVTAFAFEKQYITNNCQFLAADGVHLSQIISDNLVKIKMLDVNYIVKHDDGYEINTGSPHFIIEVNNALENIDVYNLGKEIRYQSRFGEKGINVNFVQKIDENTLFVRTYERGVEAETLSCGTGSVASAIFSVLNRKDDKYNTTIRTLGGLLNVYFEKNGLMFNNIWLTGKAEKVFEGTIKI